MISILDRYIGKNVSISILLALLALVALDSFFTLVRELDEIGRGDYDFTEAMIFIGMTTPHRIYEFFPIAALLGSIVGLGVLATNSELTVMRAAGISITRIVISIFKTGIILVVIVFMTGEFVVPVAEQYAETRRSLKLIKLSALKSEYGFWSRDDYSFINIRDIDRAGHIGELYIYEFDSSYRLRRSTYASEASYINGEWILSDIVQSDISETKIVKSSFSEAKWGSLLNPELLKMIVIDPARMPIRDLFGYTSFLKKNGQNADRFSLALWSKLLSPFAIAVMLLLAVPFVFGPLRSVGIGQRIMVGFLVGLGFHVTNQAFSQLGIVYSMSPSVSAILPVLLFFAGAMFFIRRI